MSEETIVAVHSFDKGGKTVLVFGEGVKRREVPEPLTYQLRKYTEKEQAVPVVITKDGAKIFKPECGWIGTKADFEKKFLKEGFTPSAASVEDYRELLNAEEAEYAKGREEFAKQRESEREQDKERQAHFEENRARRFKAMAEMRERAAKEKAARIEQEMLEKEKKDGKAKSVDDGGAEPRAKADSGP